MPILLLARHGETAFNAERRWQGHHDAPLSANGRAQAHARAEGLTLERPGALYSSDLPRARETAEAIAQRSGLVPVFDPQWREVDVGEVTKKRTVTMGRAARGPEPPALHL